MTGEEFIFLSKYASNQTEAQPQPVYGHRKKVCVRNTWHCQIVRVQSAYRQPYKEKRKDRQSHYANRAQDYRGCGTCP